jgi:anti-sigma regulatory factor (Ser/Thr protein kinase)
MNTRQELVLLGAAPDLALEALRWTEAACTRAGLDSHSGGALAGAVVEAVNNSLEHGYALAPGDINLTLCSDAVQVVVTVTDRGEGLPPRPRLAEPAPQAERGRGSWLMQQACDEVRHEFAPGLQSVVLVKLRDRIPTTSSGDPS